MTARKNKNKRIPKCTNKKRPALYQDWDPQWSAQFLFLNTMMTREVPMFLYDQNGAEYRGYILSFDIHTLLFGSKNKRKIPRIFYKNNLALLVPQDQSLTLQAAELLPASFVEVQP